MGGCVQKDRGSVWWKELWNLEKVHSHNNEWIRKGFVKRVGEGKDTFFWDEIWVGEMSLEEKFPRLYSIATNKLGKVAELGEWDEGVWKWKWSWRRELFAWEFDLVQELEDTLRTVSTKQGTEDCWVWRWDGSGQYTIRTAYKQLSLSQQVQSNVSFKHVWNRHIPLKVSALAWRAIHDRLPTKINLERIGVIKDSSGTKCSLCSAKEEKINHLLFKCSFSWNVWASCFLWWGISSAICMDVFAHLEQHAGLIGNRNLRKAWRMVWFAAVWSIWLYRNQATFNNEQSNEKEIMELVKDRSFYWVRQA